MGGGSSTVTTNCEATRVEIRNEIMEKYEELWTEIYHLKQGNEDLKGKLCRRQTNYEVSQQNKMMHQLNTKFGGLQDDLMKKQKHYEESHQNEMIELKGKICDIATVVKTLETAKQALTTDLKKEQDIIKELQQNFLKEKKKIEGLKSDIQELKDQINVRELKEVIPRKNLWQQFKESNGYYLSKQRVTDAESVKDNENDSTYLLPVPWRPIHKALTEISEIKDDLMQSISAELKNHDSTLNILLLGETGSGKSSFVNACFTALLQEEQYIARATAGAMTSDSVTLRLAPYTLEVKIGEEEKSLPVKLFDCRGLFYGDRGVKTADIKKICKGHIKDGYMINPKIGIKATDKEHRKDPLEEHRMHCIVFVLAADEEGFVTEGVEEQMKEIKRIFREDTLQLILLTKIDRLGIKDIRQIFRDKRVK